MVPRMRAQLLHLSGPERGRTVTYETRSVQVGTAADNEVQLHAPAVAEHHAVIRYVEEECAFHLRKLDGQVFVNGDEVEEVILQDGDQLEFGAGGPMARFRIYVPNGAVCKPVRRMLADARLVQRYSGGAAATQTLTRDLLTQATPRLKVGFPLVVAASALLAGWLGGWLGGRVVETRHRETADDITRAQLLAMQQEQEKQQREIERLARANDVVGRIQREWTRGVCLLHGVFRLRLLDGELLSIAADRPFEIEYTGSGFLVSAAGDVVTNRHVVAPWLEMETIAALVDRGATPEFSHLTATFPGLPPIDVPPASVRRRDDDLDVAVVKLPATAVAGVPVLPLCPGTFDGDDRRAIVVGYPTGLAALLARADSELVASLQRDAANMTRTIAVLAETGQITPTLTQGVISNVQPRVISYDASTTHGGSGGPVFGGSGEVIAVNFAILPDFSGANFGVPIRFARELVAK
jgi:serine protease Do